MPTIEPLVVNSCRVGATDRGLTKNESAEVIGNKLGLLNE